MRFDLVTIGDELLLGLTIDTNGAFIARELAELGGQIARRVSVGDAADEIARAVGEALERTGAVITTGGLGPTSDDLTRPAIAAVFGRDMYFDEVQWQRIRALWQARARPGEPPEANKQQVMLPEGCVVLENPIGTAPGIFLEDSAGRWTAMLPGVPGEMRAMLNERLIPLLLSRGRLGENVVRSRTLRTTGVAESMISEMLGSNARGFDDVSLAYLPGLEGVDLRLTVRDAPPDVADARLEARAAILRARMERYLYGQGTLTLPEVVLELCRARALTIATAESCTGGLLASRLTSIPGSSDVFLGGVVSYANEVKESLLGVPQEMLDAYGAVSSEVAQAMAAGVRERLGASIGIALTGVAGPGGGTPEKPVGLVWIAVDFGDWQRVYKGHFFISREDIRFRATQSALDAVRRRIEVPGDKTGIRND
ncbi:MAG: CinA-like protein [Gemmatimonadaceae bacterium]|nr:CinA-like protein [Gemmatimonadaceae bacterium]